MSDLAKFLIKAYARKLLTILGTFLLTHGLLTSSADAFVSDYLDEVVGAVLIGVSAVWTTAYQWYVKRKVKTALKLEAGATPNQLAKALGEK